MREAGFGGPGSRRELHVRSGSVDGAGPASQTPLVTTAEMVGAAHRDGVGITAYNVITLEHAEAIVAAAEWGP